MLWNGWRRCAVFGRRWPGRWRGRLSSGTTGAFAAARSRPRGGVRKRAAARGPARSGSCGRRPGTGTGRLCACAGRAFPAGPWRAGSVARWRLCRALRTGSSAGWRSVSVARAFAEPSAGPYLIRGLYLIRMSLPWPLGQLRAREAPQMVRPLAVHLPASGRASPQRRERRGGRPGWLVTAGWRVGGPNGRPGRVRRCRLTSGCAGSGWRCCGTMASYRAIRMDWRTVSSGKRRAGAFPTMVGQCRP